MHVDVSVWFGSVVVTTLDLQSTGRGFDPSHPLPSSDPGQVVHMCHAPLKLRLHGVIEILLI